MNSRHPGSRAHGRAAVPFTSTRVVHAFVAALPAFAGGAAFAQAGDVLPAQEVVVSAARVEQKLPDTLPSTTLITRADIEASTAADVPGLLRTLTSLDIAQTGPRGSATSVFVRGSNSNQVLVLIDGAPLSRADFGSAPWELVPLDQIDHVEVVRGNLSSLYGAQAVGGVVQIFTRRDGGKSVSLGLGNEGQLQASASLGLRAGDAERPLTIGVSVSGQTTDGYDATDAVTNPGTNRDTDGSHQTSAAVRVGKTWAPNQRTEFSVTHTDTQSDYDGYDPTAHDVLTTALDAYSLRSHHALGSAVTLNVSAGETVIKYEDPTSTYITGGVARSRLVGADLDWLVSDNHSLQLGVEDKNERYNDNIFDNEQKRETTAVRLGYVGSFLSAVDVQANLRRDDAGDYGTANTGLLALGWRISPAWKLVGQVSTGFSAPSFTEQFYKDPSVAELRPEHSRDLEFGAHWTGAGWLARATWFSQRQHDLIAFGAKGDVNIGHAHSRGVELAADGALGPGKLGLDTTFQNAHDDDSGAQLLRRARTSAALNYRLPIAGWETGASVRYTGRRTDVQNVAPYGTVFIASRTVVGLATSHALDRNWTIGAKLDNALDAREAEVLGYTAPRRTLLFTLRGQWL